MVFWRFSRFLSKILLAAIEEGFVFTTTPMTILPDGSTRANSYDFEASYVVVREGASTPHVGVSRLKVANL
jgi:hypothetical protein